MTETFYLARQAIVDNNESILGYELLYRSNESETNIDNPRHATSSLLVNVLNQSGLASVVGKSLAFINVDYSFLQHDFIESIPPKTFVFELGLDSNAGEKLLETVQLLHAKKYIFSIDIDASTNIDLVKRLAPYLFFVKIDVTSFDKEHLSTLVQELKTFSVIAIASKLEDEETFLFCQEAGFDAYQGYFFAHPTIVKDKKLDTDQVTLFKLCNIIQAGASISEIVEAFEESPTITMQLLRFINSAAFHFKSPIRSIHQIVTLLGRNSLVQWLMLLLYSKNFTTNVKYQDQLIVMVKQRTLIMVNLLKLIQNSSSEKELSEAYFVGVLSLMNALTQAPLEDILEEFYVDNSVREALFYKAGILGELYKIVLAVEDFDVVILDAFIKEHNIVKADFEKMMLNVFKDAIDYETAVETE